MTTELTEFTINEVTPVYSWVSFLNPPIRGRRRHVPRRRARARPVSLRPLQSPVDHLALLPKRFHSCP